VTPEPSTVVTPADASLIEQSRAEPELFAAVFDRHAAELHRYVVRRLGMSAADDIVADTSWWHSGAETTTT